MAKAKSKKNTIEDTLVSVEEQPYEIPENWCWVKFEYLTKDMADGPFGSNLKTEHYTDKPEVRIIQLSNVSEGAWRDDNKKYTTFEHVKTISRSIVEPGNIVVTKMMPAGRAMICPNEERMYVLSSDNIKVVPIDGVDTKFMEYGINSHVFNTQVVENTQGITRARTSIKKIKGYSFPLPPLPEQQRIVEQIERLFSKLDEAKEKASLCVESFDDRKTMIIHNAFQGKYTEKWRNNNRIDIDTWKEMTLNDVAEYKKGPFGSSITKAMFVPKGEDTYKVYEQGNAIRKTIDYGHYYISKTKYEELKGFAVKAGDIIISCAGTIGEVYKLPEESEQGVINQALMRVRLNENIDENFFIYYFGEVLKGDVNEQANGTAIKNIPPFKIMKAMLIKLPCLEEQREIVRILDDLLNKEEEARESAELVMDSVNLMKKSILAKAFRGELGTNDPSEESPIELLKQIMEA